MTLRTSHRTHLLSTTGLRLGVLALTAALAVPAALSLAGPSPAGAAQTSTRAVAASAPLAAGRIHVAWVEKNLAGMGWLYSREVDGAIRSGDVRGIKNFQSSRCLKVDGIAGPRTWAAIKARVRAVQSTVGVSTDGYYGPLTRAAVRRYQASHGLVVDGIAGPRTMDRMKVSRYTGDCR